MLGLTVTYFPRTCAGSARSPVRTERSFFTGSHATVPVAAGIWLLDSLHAALRSEPLPGQVQR